jgi:hypothetical protein
MPLLPFLCGTVFDFIGGAIKVCDNTPWPCEWIKKLVDMPPGRVGPYSAASKHNIVDRIDFGVQLMRINEFTVSCMLFLDKDCSDLMGYLQMCSKIL